MAWHEPLIRRLDLAIQGQYVEPPPSAAWLFESGGTGNYKAMAWSCEYLRAYRDGSLQDRAAARARALLFFKDQLAKGHMALGPTCEQTCPDPHYGFWLSSVAGFHLGALRNQHTDVLQLVREWWRAHHSILALCAAPGGGVVMPGLRCKTPAPLNELATGIYRQLHGIRQTGALSHSWASGNRYYLAVTGLQKVQEYGGETDQMIATPSRPPYLKIPMTVTRWTDGHLAALDKPAAPGVIGTVKGWLRRPDAPVQYMEPCDWVLATYGGKVEVGKDWATPAPAPPAGAVVRLV